MFYTPTHIRCALVLPCFNFSIGCNIKSFDHGFYPFNVNIYMKASQVITFNINNMPVKFEAQITMRNSLVIFSQPQHLPVLITKPHNFKQLSSHKYWLHILHNICPCYLTSVKHKDKTHTKVSLLSISGTFCPILGQSGCFLSFLTCFCH